MDTFSIAVLFVVALSVVVVIRYFNKVAAEEEAEEMLADTMSARVDAVEAEIEEDSGSQEVIDFIDSQIVDRFPTMGEKCRHAGIKAPAGVVLAGGIAVIAIIAIAATVFLAPKLGPILGFFVPIAATLMGIGASLYTLESMIKARVTEFDEQFGVGLEVLSAAMGAGNTFSGGLKFIAESMDPPIGREFGIVSTEMSLGVDVSTAMDRIEDRVPSKNLFLFTTAVKVANQTGAALAPTFIVLSRVITERFRLQGLINIAIAQNSGAMLILAGMPWGICPFLVSAWPEAFDAFMSSLLGQVVMVVLFLWYCLGIYLMYKTVKGIDS